MKTEGNHPDYKVTIRGQHDYEKARMTHITAIVHLANVPAPVKAGEVVCSMDTHYANIANYVYTSSTCRARDESGPLTVSFSTKEGDGKTKATHDWTLDRDTSGDIFFELDVYPREVDKRTTPGPKLDMRFDQTGLTFGGFWFLPNPQYAKRYNLQLEWDLTGSPPTTNAIWSFGSADGVWTDEGPYELLANCVFMIGEVNTFIPTMFSGEPSPKCSIHWLGEVPGWILKPANIHGELWKYSLETFKGRHGRFKVFIRRGTRGYGGNGFNNSYALEHDNPKRPIPEIQVAAFFAHEMVHTWLWLGDDDGVENTWFNEGVANFYGLYMPVRAGIEGIQYFRQILDGYLCSYYTNPYIGLDLTTAAKDFWNNEMISHIPYCRGALYLLMVEIALRKSPAFRQTSRDVNCLDTIINALHSGRSWDVNKTSSKDWLEELYCYLDKDEVDKQFNAMRNGTILDLEGLVVPVPHNGQLQLKRTEHEVVEHGFDRRQSLEKQVIAGIIPGSRAQLAGLEDGDQILESSVLSGFSDHPDLTRSMIVKKAGSGEVKEYVFRPRSFKKVPSLVSEVMN